MRIQMKLRFMNAAISAAFISGAVSANNLAIEEVTIVGTREEARTLPGSGAVIDSEQMTIEAATDINQLLKTVPGIYIREEDGYGLRPNIGIRGATSERSGKITLLEDGVMIAPAPYSNPSAYYFPTISRMSSLEVLKGASLLRYGPQTTGGVVNMVSTPIPEEQAGNINLAFGENHQVDLLANYGGHIETANGNFGWLVETAQRQSDGFKEIDRSSDGSGYDIQDYLLKLAWEGESQSLLFKAQYSDETSDETYLGLTDGDFNASENRRYGLSAIDQMKNDHQGYSLSYRLQLSEAVTATAVAYYNKFSRDWFKLSGGNSFINAANAGDSSSQSVLNGTQDIQGLQYKHNNRDYESRGIELNFDMAMGGHQLAVGGRVHNDQMDRFQPVDIYNQVGGALVYSGQSTAPAGSNNRLEEADAISLWVLDSWQLGDALNLNMAMRYEGVDSWRKQYADPARTVLENERSNTSKEWLPGASLTYDLSDSWQLLAGVHRGFSPLGGGAKKDEDPETSINWEAGVRYRGPWFVEVIGFYSDFDNKSENCSNASPCSDGSTSGSFVTGQAVISGLEFQVSTVLDAGRFGVPVDMMYTYTRAEISKNSPANSFANGDQLASVPENMLSMRVGLESEFGWDNYVVAKYVDEMCVNIGCNNSASKFGKTQDLLVMDYISRYAFSEGVQVFLKVENLFDEQAIVSREPDGARPNKPRTASMGVEWTF